MPLANDNPPNSLDPQTYTQERSAVNYLNGPEIWNEYDIVEGVSILPLAESPPESPGELVEWSPVVKIRLHSPYRIRTAKFTATKQNGPPVMPGTGDQGAFIFTGGSVLFNNVWIKDGVVNWNCQSTYQYVENCVSRDVDGYVLGQPAFPYPASEGMFSILGGVSGGVNGGTPSVSSPGAIAYAGTDAKIGWFSAASMGPDFYNFVSYYPGIFINDGLMNASLVSTDGTGPSGPVQPVP